MSQIKGKNTKPEILVRKFLFSKGFPSQEKMSGLPSKPKSTPTRPLKLALRFNFIGHFFCIS